MQKKNKQTKKPHPAKTKCHYTFMVGLRNGHTCKNCTQNSEPERYDWEHRRRSLVFFSWWSGFPYPFIGNWFKHQIEHVRELLSVYIAELSFCTDDCTVSCLWCFLNVSCVQFPLVCMFESVCKTMSQLSVMNAFQCYYYCHRILWKNVSMCVCVCVCVFKFCAVNTYDFLVI